MSTSEAIEASEQALRLLGESRTRIFRPPMFEVIKDEGRVGVNAAFLEPLGLLVMRNWTSYFHNAERYGLPSVQGIMLIFDVLSGVPLCVMEGTWLAGMVIGSRTAVGAKYLARKDSKVVGIVGAGTQGRGHLRALCEIFDFREIRVTDKSSKALEGYAQEMSSSLKKPIRAVDSVEECVRGADIVVTVTTANEPLIKTNWVEPGMFLAKVGGGQEIEPEILTTVDKFVVNDWPTIKASGKEVRKLLEIGAIRDQDVYAELPQIVVQKVPGRENDQEKILLIPSNAAADYAACAIKAYHNALSSNMGQRLTWVKG